LLLLNLIQLPHNLFIMKKYITASAITLMVLLSSCKVSKDTAIPKDALPETYREVTSTDTTSIGDVEWKTFFTEPTLQALINNAVTKNNDLLVAQKNIEIAQLQFRQTKWNNIPNLNLQVGATSTNPSANSLNGVSLSQFLGQNHIDDFTASVGLSWEADIWGRIKNTKRSALAQYLQTEEAKKALQTTIVATVAKGFYNLLMLDAQLEIAKRNLELNERTLTIINLQFDAGQVTSLAKQQAEAQRLVAAQLVPQLEQNIGIQENALSILAGSFPQSVERKVVLNAIASGTNLQAGVPSSLVSRRPDVKGAEFALMEANAETGIAKAGLYPSLNITATGGVNAFEASKWFNIPASLFGIVAGSVAQPLLNAKRLRTNYEIAKVQREKAVINFRQQVLVAVSEVSNSLIQIEKLESSYTIAASRVKTLQTAVGNADMLFQNGMANYLEVITAQGNLLQSELELVSQKKSRLEADVELYRSLGGGWR
jgi:multidrug efflux system outer membrane protein